MYHPSHLYHRKKGVPPPFIRHFRRVCRAQCTYLPRRVIAGGTAVARVSLRFFVMPADLPRKMTNPGSVQERLLVGVSIDLVRGNVIVVDGEKHRCMYFVATPLAKSRQSYLPLQFSVVIGLDYSTLYK